MDTSKPSLPYRMLCRFRRLLISIYQKSRVYKYRMLSSIYHCQSLARLNQPVLMTGRGSVRLGNCNLGVWQSPYYLSGYIYVEARESGANIDIEDGVWINNNAVIIADRSSIRIGAGTLIGTEFTVYDSDFHDPHPDRRMAGTHQCSSVTIGKNVFIGSRVMVLKGVDIGDNSVIASGAVVTRSVPADCIAGGVPARVIRYLSDHGQKSI